MHSNTCAMRYDTAFVAMCIKKTTMILSTKTHRLKTRLLQLTNANETRVYVIHSILLTLERKILQATTKSST